jgi:1-acyl-sn-glycerol-3-phosphate acyltransferase
VIRLIHDPQVMEAVAEYARTEDVPHNVAFARARSYAREIVPGFSTATYFGFAIRVARRLSRGLYRVRLGRADADTLRGIDARSAVVFVMNHRSNMDYVLVTWLAADRSALSYAVGEWAQVWPLKSLIRAMGAYFIRRRYSSTLYRAVLARYVQMSIQEGVTQAMFPEGGLSLNGAVGPAKKGLLHYIVRDFDLSSGRDVVFVPVALNYDRVLEDRVLIEAAAEGTRRFRVRLTLAAGFALRTLWQKARGTFRHFGYAAVCYGQAAVAARVHDRPARRQHRGIGRHADGAHPRGGADPAGAARRGGDGAGGRCRRHRPAGRGRAAAAGEPRRARRDRPGDRGEVAREGRASAPARRRRRRRDRGGAHGAEPARHPRGARRRGPGRPGPAGDAGILRGLGAAAAGRARRRRADGTEPGIARGRRDIKLQ